MPSFLSKVFGRKKDEKDTPSPTSSPTTEKRSSAPPLLDGKYEAVSPTHPSPSTSSFQDSTRLTAGPSKESPLALFRPKSKNVEHTRKSNVKPAPAPHLTLNLPEKKEESNRALDVVFESVPEEPAEKDLGERRLTPAETLKLVQASSKAIIEHGGLETLGLMHPHWYASSDEVQRRLVSLFLLSLTSKASTPSSETAFALFDSELKYTRASHDVAAVLRWGLRHLKLEGTSFGKDASEWAWYATFASSERQAGFPPTAFSQTLVPLLPPSHVQLLKATLDIIESLAAHAEANGSSRSKLSKLFGLWLVAAQRVNKEEDWAEFYKRWETAGRILEHLFLAHVREESSLSKMPLRLSELVKHYPYGTTASTEANELLPFLVQPRFSTRTYEALYIRLNTELPSIDSPQPSRKHPLHLISEAITAKTSDNASLASDVVAVWQNISKQALGSDRTTDGFPVLSQVLDDETIRILSLVPGADTKPPSPIKPTETAPPTSPIIRAPTRRRRSSSLGPASRPAANGNGNGNGREAAPPTDWADFSKLGFGESSLGQNLNLSLNDSDVEVTPSKVETPVASKRRRASSPGRGRKSLDNPRENGRSGLASTPELSVLLTHVGAVTIDEAFFEFWSDALLDPIAADWPNFVVAQLKPSAWKYPILIVEQTFTRPAPPPLPPIPQFENTTRRASSPRPSLAPSSRGRRSFNFSPTIKRFSFFSNHNTSATDVNSKAATHKGKAVTPSSTKSPKIGELGEIVPEETIPETDPVKGALKESASQGLGITIAEDGEKKPEKGSVPIPPEAATSTAAVIATAAVTSAAAIEVSSADKNDVEQPAAKEKEKEDLPPVPLVEAEPVDASTSATEGHPVAVEPVKTEEEAPARPSISSDRPAPAATDAAANVGGDAEKQLPPAPEGVVLTGGTPGPQVALETSESITLAHTSEQKVESTAEITTPVIENAPPLPTKDELVDEAAQDEPSENTAVADTAEPVTEPVGPTSTQTVPPVVAEEVPASDVAAEEPAVVDEVPSPAPAAEESSTQDPSSVPTESEGHKASAEQRELSTTTSPESAEAEAAAPFAPVEATTATPQTVEQPTVHIAEDNQLKDEPVAADVVATPREEAKTGQVDTPESVPVEVEHHDDTPETVTSIGEDLAVTDANTGEQAASEVSSAPLPSQDDSSAHAIEIPEVHKPVLDTSDDTPAPHTETETHKEESVVESASS